MRQHLDIAHEGTLDAADRIDMTFDENSIAHLMSVLIDLYSDRELAVIREYSTNAWDSHVEAGNTDPIKVTLPNLLSPFFVIEDRGVGMSLDTLRDRFTKYGFSSKRESDDVAGMLGLGCKAGLTYTSQFTLISTHDGWQHTVLVTRNPNGAGALQIIASIETDQANGVTIQVPVKDHDTFSQKARDFYRFWDDGTVLVDDEIPLSVWSNTDHILVDPDVVIMPDAPHSYLVMGQVPYIIENQYLDGLSHKTRLVARVPIGTVNFVPSREYLDYTKRTKDTIETLKDFYFEATFRSAQAQLDQVTDVKEVHRLFRNWQPTIEKINAARRVAWRDFKGVSGSGYIDYWDGFHELTLRRHSVAIPYSLKCDEFRSFDMGLYQRGYDHDHSRRIHQVNIEELYRYAFVVIGHMGTAVSGITKAKIRKWYEEHKAEFETIDVTQTKRILHNKSVLIVPHHFGGEWLDACRIVTYDEIKKVELPREAKEKLKIDKTEYRLVGDSHNTGKKLDKLPESVVAWIPAISDISRASIFHYVHALDKDVAIVLANDVKKFKRKHPEIPEFIDWFTKDYEMCVRGLSPMATYRSFGYVSSDGKFMGFDGFVRRGEPAPFFNISLPGMGRNNSRATTDQMFQRILDPELRDTLLDWRRAYLSDESQRLTSAVNLALELKVDIVKPNKDFIVQIHELVTSLAERYPLLKIRPNPGEESHFIDAINAQYFVRSIHRPTSLPPAFAPPALPPPLPSALPTGQSTTESGNP